MHDAPSIRWRAALAVAVALALAAATAGILRERPTRTRLLVVGFDGATWDLVRPWMQAGAMPNLAALVGGGVSSTLVTVLPADSPPGWTSAITGVNPGKHGLFGFMRPLGPDGTNRFVTSEDRRYVPVWTLLSRAGHKVGVINVPCTSPPDPVDGFMVGGFPHEKGKAVAHPADVLAGFPDYRTEVFGSSPDPGREDAWLAEQRQVEAARQRLALAKLKEGGYDLFFVVFTATDRVQHHFWRLMDPRHPLYDAALAGRLGHAVRDVHAQVDAYLGQLVRAAGPGAMTMVLSDHGFGPAYHGISVDALLARFNPGWKSGDPLRAYLYSAYGGVFVAVHGRESFGAVEPQDYEHERDDLSAMLRGLTDPSAGTPLIREVHRREELWSGEAVPKAPDLLFVEAVGSSRVDLQACKLEYSIVSPK